MQHPSQKEEADMLYPDGVIQSLLVECTKSISGCAFYLCREGPRIPPIPTFDLMSPRKRRVSERVVDRYLYYNFIRALPRRFEKLNDAAAFD